MTDYLWTKRRFNDDSGLGSESTSYLVEPFASVYDDRSRLGVILARGRSGFEAYAADDHSLGLFTSPRKAAAAITTTRPWVAVPSTLLARADEVIE
jgi:hypothetical protein